MVLISPDGERWGWPGGRPEPGESWEPAHEIPFRRIVPVADLAGQLWMEPGAEGHPYTEDGWP